MKTMCGAICKLQKTCTSKEGYMCADGGDELVVPYACRFCCPVWVPWG